ncbi:LysM domain-containing protein [Cryobacterium sp. TMT3-29-2]|uniref:LysM peptidoglycan-binding domain-containing protein n=1 Tax=Cryobacterium sp. TMT3-29-2 TaxID=2555867 RepID=UPI0010742461|nr:LysM domain-containing protein [Cryobacterium sp. TMT3-29-2]TFC86661.1 LysM domain-containing protein [Cryobacterium sp. TMT3-29-2]
MPRLTTSVLGSIALVLGLVACSPPTTQTPPVDTAVHTDASAPPDGAVDVVIPDGVIGTAELTSAPDGCVLTPGAVGTITWDLPDTRPGLLAVDTGARFGAGGATASADGAPLSYRAVADDTLNDIAERFGITDDDLGFLNPLTSRQLQAGDDLNLQVALRGGASVSPPWA